MSVEMIAMLEMVVDLITILSWSCERWPPCRTTPWSWADTERMAGMAGTLGWSHVRLEDKQDWVKEILILPRTLSSLVPAS